jgi:hypothetical protein
LMDSLRRTWARSRWAEPVLPIPGWGGKCSRHLDQCLTISLLIHLPLVCILQFCPKHNMPLTCP